MNKLIKFENVTRESIFTDSLLDFFAAADQTVANVEKDFISWHHGQPYYYFWAVMIDDPSWLTCIQKAQKIVSPFVLPGYQRQPHITILPLGFNIDLARWSQAIQSLPLPNDLELTATALSSFTTCPILEVKEKNKSLHRIRRCLSKVQYDSNMRSPIDDYASHLTLGLYDKAYDTAEVSKTLSTDLPLPPSLKIDQLVLARYRTNEIQGPIEIQLKYSLGSKQSVVSN